MERKGRRWFETLVEINVQRLKEEILKEEMRLQQQQLEKKRKEEAERKTVNSYVKKAKTTKKKEREILPPPLLDLNDSKNNFSWSEINDGGFKMLFQRVLTATDVKWSAHRLFLNKMDTVASLLSALTNEEKEKVQKLEQGLPVVGVDHMGRRYNIVIKYWPSVQQYALIKDWIFLAENNGFTKGVRIEVSCFRHGQNNELGLLITPC